MRFEAGGFRSVHELTILDTNGEEERASAGFSQVRKMQLSDREIQNTLDLLKKKQSMGEEEASAVLSAEEIEGIQQVVRRIDEMPPVRQDRVEKVRRALESSSYNVSGDDVAKKLIGRIISDKLH